MALVRERTIPTYKKLGFKITLKRELNNKVILKNSLPSTAHESQFRDKQKFYRLPKQRHPLSTEILGN
jgi:hypothetical protein